MRAWSKVRISPKPFVGTASYAKRSRSVWAAFLIAILMFALLLTLNCGPRQERLLVFSAASLRDAIMPLGDEYGNRHKIDVRFNLGGSSTLAQQILRGAPADLFISAGSYPMDLIEERGLVVIDTRTDLLTNELALIVPTKNAKRDSTLTETLLRSERLAIADPNLAPAGRYAREALQNLGLWDTLRARVIFGADVRAALAYVESGNADVGIVYLTDVLKSEEVKVSMLIPREMYTAITYPVAVLKTSNHQEMSAEFIKFLGNQASMAQLKHFGFGVVGDL